MSPNQPKTPGRNIRVSDDTWKKAQKKAEERGESVSDAVRRCLDEYTRDQDDEKKK